MGSYSEVEYETSNVWEFGNRGWFDLHVLLGEDVFKLHRHTIEEVSGYMKQKLESVADSSDRRQICVELNEAKISPETFGTICIWLYTGRLKITATNIASLRAAATYLRIPEVMKMCRVFKKNAPRELLEKFDGQPRSMRKSTKSTPESTSVKMKYSEPDVIITVPPWDTDTDTNTKDEPRSSSASDSRISSGGYSSDRRRPVASLTKLLPAHYVEQPEDHRATSSDNASTIDSAVSEDGRRLSWPDSDRGELAATTDSTSSLNTTSLLMAPEIATSRPSRKLRSVISRSASEDVTDPADADFLGISTSDFLMLLRRPTRLHSPAAIRPWDSIPIVDGCSVIELAQAEPEAMATVLSWIRDGRCTLTLWNVEPVIRLACYLSIRPLFLRCVDYALHLVRTLEAQLLQWGVVESSDLPRLFHTLRNMHVYFDESCEGLRVIREAASGWPLLPNVVALSTDNVPSVDDTDGGRKGWLDKLAVPREGTLLMFPNHGSAPPTVTGEAEPAAAKVPVDGGGGVPEIASPGKTPDQPASTPATPSPGNGTPGSGKLRQKLYLKWAGKSKGISAFRHFAAKPSVDGKAIPSNGSPKVPEGDGTPAAPKKPIAPPKFTPEPDEDPTQRLLNEIRKTNRRIGQNKLVEPTAVDTNPTAPVEAGKIEAVKAPAQAQALAKAWRIYYAPSRSSPGKAIKTAASPYSEIPAVKTNPRSAQSSPSKKPTASQAAANRAKVTAVNKNSYPIAKTAVARTPILPTIAEGQRIRRPYDLFRRK